MSQFDKFVDTYLCKALRKLRWGCWSFLLVAVVVHNTLDEHPEDFAFGTFLFGMSVSMFLFLYCFKKLMPKSFRPGVYVVGKVDEDTVKISSSESGIFFQIPKEQYLSSIQFDKEDLQVVSAGNFVCKSECKEQEPK